MIGTTQLVLVESESLRSSDDWQGRNDQNIKTILPKRDVIEVQSGELRQIRPGDYVDCKVVESNAQTLKADPLFISSISHNYNDLDHIARGKLING